MDNEDNKTLVFLKKWLGLLILAAAILFSTLDVLYMSLTYEAPDVTTVRLTHWQLEAGFRESLQGMIDEYEKLYEKKNGRKIRILQMPISTKAYPQYVNSSLVGGVAPDIIEQGFASTATDVSYISRYFEPLGKAVDEPNPYNKGTDMEKMEWRQTFFDGMQGQYLNELQDYYSIPFSMFTVRIYLNRSLYFKITGRETLPTGFIDLLKVCEKVREYNEKNKTNHLSIAASKYQKDMFAGKYLSPFYVNVISQCDFNMDGKSDLFESYLAYRQGAWKFTDDYMRLGRECTMQVTAHFPIGWMALDRDDALFQFVQGNAMMMATGSWDASSITRQVGTRFKIGVFDFPTFADHPEYKKYANAQVSEAGISGGIKWGVNAQSRYKDVAIDFLRFCTTRENNQKFNESIVWLPVVTGAQIIDLLKPFTPRIEGYPSLTFETTNISSESNLVAEGYSWPLYSGRMSIDEYNQKVQEIYEKSAAAGFEQKLDLFGRRLRTMESMANADLALTLYEKGRKVDEKMAERLSAAQTQGVDVNTNAGRFRELVGGSNEGSDGK